MLTFGLGIDGSSRDALESFASVLASEATVSERFAADLANALALRLKRLEADGMIQRKQYMDRPPRYEYELTEMGRAFYPVILALREWGETWCKSADEDVAVRYMHLTCGHGAGIGTVCQACGEPLRREDLKAKLSPSYAKERAARQDATKALKSA